jgi:hypothetical protein
VGRFDVITTRDPRFSSQRSTVSRSSVNRGSNIERMRLAAGVRFQPSGHCSG